MNTLKRSLELAAFAGALSLSFDCFAAESPQGSSGAAIGADDTVHCYGVTSCKGQNDCGTTEYACKGNAACKGQGFKALKAKDCLAKGGTIADIKPR